MNNGRGSEGDDLWQRVKATVTPLKRGRVVDSVTSSRLEPLTTLTPLPESGKTSPRTKTAPPPHEKPPLEKKVPIPANLHREKVAGISRADARRMRKGEITLSARLDLHGMTAASAKAATASFISKACENRHNYVLVITGKGVSGKGIIRQSFPSWLEEPLLAHQVAAFCQAIPRDGGDGAWYIKLRHQNKAS